MVCFFVSPFLAKTLIVSLFLFFANEKHKNSFFFFPNATELKSFYFLPIHFQKTVSNVLILFTFIFFPFFLSLFIMYKHTSCLYSILLNIFFHFVKRRYITYNMMMMGKKQQKDKGNKNRFFDHKNETRFLLKNQNPFKSIFLSFE